MNTMRLAGCGMLTAFAWAALQVCAQQVVYVDAAATGDNTGADWRNAYTSLRTAVDNTWAGTQIWVAEGTYLPGSSRTDSFMMKTNMVLYGGFVSGMTSLAERDWVAHPTILSGEIQGDGNSGNNAYHILIANTNAVLDGFVLTGGAANGTDPADKGGAVYGSYVGRDNVATWPQTIANCVFSNNVAVSGGAVYGNYSCYYITNTLFAQNVATNGGAMHINQFTNSRKIELVDCVFRLNWVVSQGGAIYANAFQKWPVTRCLFIGNTAGSGGGAIQNTSSWMADGCYNCLFVENKAGETGNGGAVNYGNPGLHLYESVFVRNSAGGGSGGAISPFNANSFITVSGCTFVGNFCKGDGGAMNLGGRALRARNCLFAGNASTNGTGGGAYLTTRGVAYQAVLTNCTFSGNWAKLRGGGQVVSDGKQVTNVNSILWGNTATASQTPNQIYGASAGCLYSDIQGGWTGAGENNMDADPRFAMGPSGVWTAVGTYDPEKGQTMLTDSAANWTPGALVGLCINTATNQILQVFCVTNTVTEVTVWGDVTAFTAVGDRYQVWDYHLRSTGGRWTPLGWVDDTVSSPCIDGGDPASPYALEPKANGSRVNMGAYGNTPQASKPSIKGTVLKLF